MNHPAQYRVTALLWNPEENTHELFNRSVIATNGATAIQAFLRTARREFGPDAQITPLKVRRWGFAHDQAWVRENGRLT